MKNYLLPFLSIIIGVCLVLWIKPNNKSRIKLLLAFSGAFLLGMTVFTLIPEIYHAVFESDSSLHTADLDEVHTHGVGKTIGLWIIIGILLQIVLEFFSHGAEHGHFHSPAKGLRTQFPWGLFISLSIHSILEGFPLHAHSNMVYGIFIHHLPIAMVLTIFFLDSGIGTKKTLIFLFLFSLMTPFGAFLANTVPQLVAYHTQMSAIVIGIFLHISSVILFETSENHHFNYLKLGVIVLGFALAYPL